MNILLRVRDRVSSEPQRILKEQIFNEPVVSIGSERSSDLVLTGAEIAREQAILMMTGDAWYLIVRADGMSLNGEGLDRNSRRLLADSDLIGIGEYAIEVMVDAQDDRAAQAQVEITVARQNGHGATDGATRGTGNGGGPRDSAVTLREADSAPRSFSAILENLRTIEDSFCFVLQGGPQSGIRVPIRDAEMLVGWDELFRDVCFDAARMAVPCAVVRKSWSGVMIEPQGDLEVNLNRERLVGARRLRDGDEIVLGAPGEEADGDRVAVVFHEPASLVVLDSLLPNRLPPPVTQNSDANGSSDGSGRIAGVVRPPGDDAAERPPYLGYFYAHELLMMAAGTLIVSAIVFLVLELAS